MCAEFHSCATLYVPDPLACTLELVPIFCSDDMAVNTLEHASLCLGGIAEPKGALQTGFDCLSFNPFFSLFLHGGPTAYREPYLFVTHFNSLEVIEIQARSSVG